MCILSTFYSFVCYGEEYYGYAGSCNDGIYVFDFKKPQYTLYQQNRVIGKRWTYRIISSPIKSVGNNSYIIGLSTDDPMLITVTRDRSIIQGKSNIHGYTFYFEECNKKLALEIISKAKVYVGSSPNNGN